MPSPTRSTSPVWIPALIWIPSAAALSQHGSRAADRLPGSVEGGQDAARPS